MHSVGYLAEKGLKDYPKTLNRLVRNIYKVLMTRGMKGINVHCVDAELQAYFKNRFLNGANDAHK